jgi:hypothetical protein
MDLTAHQEGQKVLAEDEGGGHILEQDRVPMEKDFRIFASGPEALSTVELEQFVDKWGPYATSGMGVASSWEWAQARPTPLWLAAMARSKSCCVVLARKGVSLSHPSGDPRADAWRYAAFNGWAAEAAILFEAQASHDMLAQDWPGLWECVSHGCLAQSQGFTERAAGWIGALIGKKISSQQTQLLASLGAALEKSLPNMPTVPSVSLGGWDALATRAQEVWGPSSMAQARPALTGHANARDLALGVCVSDQQAAQSEMGKMMSTFSDDKNELALRMAFVIGGSGAKSGLDGWPTVRKTCKLWASSLGKLVHQGASMPEGVLSQACAEGQWAKAYALALAGAKPSEGAPPPLWQLSNSRQQGTLVDTISGILSPTASMSDDEQAVDVAQALSQLGCRCCDLGPDGLDALERLRLDRPSPTAALAEAIGSMGSSAGALGGAVSGPAADQYKKRSLQDKGLSGLEEFLLSLKEREEISDVASESKSSASGAQRL